MKLHTVGRHHLVEGDCVEFFVARSGSMEGCKNNPANSVEHPSSPTSEQADSAPSGAVTSDPLGGTSSNGSTEHTTNETRTESRRPENTSTQPTPSIDQKSWHESRPENTSPPRRVNDAEQQGQIDITTTTPSRSTSGSFADPVISQSTSLNAAHGEAGSLRFMYTAKPSRAERDRGCGALPVRSGGEATDRKDGAPGTIHGRAGTGRTGGARNIHPTVKPAALIRWLVQLVTPPGGTVLDPFAGSGTIFLACEGLDVEVNAIERDPEYVQIAIARGSSCK